MTDKELAKKYVKEEKYVARYDMEQTELDEIVEETYIAGLKAGRPQWHIVADGDLPKEDATVLDEAGDRVHYVKGQFFYEDDSNFDCQPIAWCEIPTYTEDA